MSIFQCLPQSSSSSSDSKQSSNKLAPPQIALRLALIASAYFAAHLIALLFPDAEKVLAAVWPAGGIGLAALLLNPRHLWPAILATLFVAGNTANILSGRPLFISAGFMTANVLESLACACFMVRYCGACVRFTSVKNVLVLIAAAVFVNALTAFVGAGAAAFTHTAPFWKFYVSWLVADGLGILLVTPLIVEWSEFKALRRVMSFKLRLVEACAFLILWCVAVHFSFQSPIYSLYTPHPYTLVALLAWPALRFGQRGVTLSLIIMGIMAIVESLGSGALLQPGTTTNDRLLWTQIFISFTAITGFLLAANRAEIKTVENMLRKSEERLLLASHVAGFGTYSYDFESGIGDWPPEFKARLGLKADEQVLLDTDMLPVCIHPEDRHKFLTAMTWANDPHSDGRFEMDYRVFWPDGSIHWLHVCGSTEFVGEGELRRPWRATGATVDITARKQAEEERIKFENQLHQLNKMESIGRLAGGVAHDFNNMLGVIICRADIALRKVDAHHPSFSSLQEIQKAATRSADLTRQLLTFARKQIIFPKELDLNETVDGMLKMLRRLIGENIDLAWLPKKGGCQVKIDPSQVDQILANLCVNAHDAINDKGGGRITIETSTVVFDDAYCTSHHGALPGKYVLLAVNDNGCGMDTATMDNLFEPFFTTKELGKGTGLGLATVYGIVKQNNGFINVQSELGHGTSFNIYLPLYETPPEETQEQSSPVPVETGNETILLVEDEPMLLKMSMEVLDDFGYRVLTASSPAESLRISNDQKGKIHLLITDVVMPEMNGRELAKKMIALHPETKCLFMSGYTRDIIASHGILNDEINFIQKPFLPSDLAFKVREILDLE